MFDLRLISFSTLLETKLNEFDNWKDKYGEKKTALERMFAGQRNQYKYWSSQISNTIDVCLEIFELLHSLM